MPHPASDHHAQSFYYDNMIRAQGGWKQVLNLLETAAEIAQKHQTIAQVALSWMQQQPGIESVLSGLTLGSIADSAKR